MPSILNSYSRAEELNGCSESKSVILIAVDTLGGGGVERMVLDLLRHWPTVGPRPVLLLARKIGSFLRQVPSEIEILEIGISLSPWTTPWFLWRLHGLLKGRKVHGVLSHMTYMNRMLLRAGILGVITAPIVVVEHSNFLRNNNVSAMSRFRWGILRREIRWLYGHAHRVVGVSAGLARQIASLFEVSSEKVRIIVNPLDRCFTTVTTPDPLIEERLNSLSRPVLVSLARLVPEKGLDDLVLAFAAQEGGSLVILGEGPLRMQLEELVKRLGVADRVWMPGFVIAPELVLRKADLYVSASHWEGFSLALLEAYASGLPVVARNCDFGPDEIVTPDRPGRLLQDLSLTALATAIREVLATQPRFKPGSVVDLSLHDPVLVAKRYAELFLAQTL